MTPNEKLRQMKKRLGMNVAETAMIFGCGEETLRQWLTDRRKMHTEFVATLERLDSQTIQELGNKLRPDIADAFNTGRRRGMLINRNNLISTGATQ